jgi:hypothetical protein
MKVAITLVNMVDVHVVTTQSKATEEQMFKDQEPRKNKNTMEWEANRKLKNSMVESIQ